MKRGRAYLPLESPYPSMGLSVLEPSSQIDPRLSPKIVNFDIIKGILSKRRGYADLGGSLTDPVLAVYEFESLSGVKTLLAFTTKKQYKLDTSGTPSWTNITYQITGVDSDWTGNETNPILVDSVTGLDSGGTNYVKYVVISNGVDMPRYWDGGSGKFALFTPDIPSFATCKGFGIYFNHLVLVNVKVGSVYNRQQVYWSDTQKLLDFTGLNSGQVIIPEVKGEYLRTVPLRDRLALYATDSITLMSYVGGAQLYTFEQSANETRLVSPRTIVNLGPFHLFLSQENVFLYDGTSLTRTMGDKIYRQYRDELYVPHAYKAWAFHDSPRQHVYFCIPTGETTHAIYKLEYNLPNMGDSRWTRYELTERPLSMGYWSRISNLTCDSAWAQATPANQAQFPANAGSTKQGFPVRVFGRSTTAAVWDDTVGQDDGVNFTATWDSIDYTVPGDFLSVLARWIEIELELIGSTVDVFYSTDQGGTYVLAQSLALSGTWTHYRIPIDVMSSTIRIRIQNTDSTGCSLRHHKVWTLSGGPSA